MQRRTRRTWLVPTLAALPLALATALAGHEAHASGFQLKENSVQGLGRAYAGGAAAPERRAGVRGVRQRAEQAGCAEGGSSIVAPSLPAAERRRACSDAAAQSHFFRLNTA